MGHPDFLDMRGTAGPTASAAVAAFGWDDKLSKPLAVLSRSGGGHGCFGGGQGGANFIFAVGGAEEGCFEL